jgi:hypothetical protein
VFRRSRVSAGTPVSALGGRGNRAREEDERPRESTDRSRPPQNRRLAKARSGLSAISASRSAEDADVRKPGTTRSAAQLGRRGDPGGGSGSGGCAIPSRNAGEHRGGGSGRVEAGRRSSDRAICRIRQARAPTPLSRRVRYAAGCRDRRMWRCGSVPGTRFSASASSAGAQVGSAASPTRPHVLAGSDCWADAALDGLPALPPVGVAVEELVAVTALAVCPYVDAGTSRHATAFGASGSGRRSRVGSAQDPQCLEAASAFIVAGSALTTCGCEA